MPRGVVSQHLYALINQDAQTRDNFLLLTSLIISVILPMSLLDKKSLNAVSSNDTFPNSTFNQSSNPWMFEGDGPLRNGYCYLIYIICIVLISVFNYILKPKNMILFVNLSNLFHSVFAPYLHANSEILFVFIQILYATSIAVCTIIAKKIMEEKKSTRDESRKKGLIILYFYFGYQAIFMLDLAVFCFSVYMPTFEYINGIRLVCALVFLFLSRFVEWPEKKDSEHQKSEKIEHSEEKKTNNTPLWIWIFFIFASKFQSSSYNVLMNCVFPLTLGSIGYSPETDANMSCMVLANAAGMVLCIFVVFVMEQVNHLKYPTLQSISIYSAIFIIFNYSIMFTQFKDCSFEGIIHERLEDEKFWLAFLCVFCSSVNNTLLYIMTVSCIIPKMAKLSEFMSNLIYISLAIFVYIPLYHFQPQLPSFIKYSMLCGSTILTTFSYLLVEMSEKTSQSLPQ